MKYFTSLIGPEILLLSCVLEDVARDVLGEGEGVWICSDLI